MSRARGLLVLWIASSTAACLVTQSLDGLTGGGGGADAASEVTTDEGTDVAPDTTAHDGPSSDSPGLGEASPDVDAGTADASDGEPSGDVVQPDVVIGPVSCADAGVILCEDFENGLDSLKWPVMDMNYATVVVDGTQHHRGANALHANMPALTTDGSTVNAGADIRHDATTLPSPVFVRAFVMFSSAQPQSTEEFMVVQQSASPYYGLQLELDTGNAAYALTDWTVSPTFYAVSTLGAAAATWNCIEWELDPPASGTTTTNTDVWVNGTEVSSLHLANTPMSDLEMLGFGIGFYQVTSLPAYDVWIDDIYVDTQPVGCDK